MAIGNFDGVHRGHQAVIAEAGRIARAAGIPWSVLTFEPHPRTLFSPGDAPFRLTPLAAKSRLVAAMGVNCLMVIPFDAAFSKRSATAFIDDVLVTGLGARHVVAGEDFKFGHRRQGDGALLRDRGAAAGFGVTSVRPHGDGRVFSATRARDLLGRGDAPGAAAILGRDFEIEGAVERGAARGRTIGYPTANIPLDQYVLPARGVYAVRALVDGEGEPSWRDGVANIGIRPMFAGADDILEVYLFDFDAELYGRTLRVALVKYLRPEQIFDDIKALKAAIDIDCEMARRVLSEPPATDKQRATS